MRLNFSLRALFLTTTIVAAGCYWLMLPTIKAQGFARAVVSENYQLADLYFRDPKHRFLFDWNDKHWRFEASAELGRWTLGQIARGERLITLRVAFGDAGPMRARSWMVIASRSGLHKPEPFWSGAGMGGGGIL
jgi:hypothetical protein